MAPKRRTASGTSHKISSNNNSSSRGHSPRIEPWWTLGGRVTKHMWGAGLVLILLWWHFRINIMPAVFDPASSSSSSAAAATRPTTTPLDRRGQILAACGELCNLQRPVRTPDPDYGYFGETTAPVDCPALFQTHLLDEPNATVPRETPVEYLDDYTMQGRATVESWYIQDVYLGGKAKQNVWTKEEIELWKQQALDGNFEGFGNYQLIDRQTLFDAL